MLELAAGDHVGALYGHLVEGFVCNEVRRLATWHPRQLRLSHFRDKRGREVDIVIDGRRRGVVGVEVKAKYGLGADDFRGLDRLREVTGPRWTAGVVLYQGQDVVAFGDHVAIPIQALWEW